MIPPSPEPGAIAARSTPRSFASLRTGGFASGLVAAPSPAARSPSPDGSAVPAAGLRWRALLAAGLGVLAAGLYLVSVQLAFNSGLILPVVLIYLLERTRRNVFAAVYAVYVGLIVFWFGFLDGFLDHVLKVSGVENLTFLPGQRAARHRSAAVANAPVGWTNRPCIWSACTLRSRTTMRILGFARALAASRRK
jgi:hypothetical protein